jgi:hypothetical protein
VPALSVSEDGGVRKERTPPDIESEDQAAKASTGGPQLSEQRSEGTSAQLGQTRISRTISSPAPPESSVFFRRPSFMNWFAFSRKGYFRRRVSTTLRCAGVLAGTTTSQTWHRYNHNSLPFVPGSAEFPGGLGEALW